MCTQALNMIKFLGTLNMKKLDLKHDNTTSIHHHNSTSHHKLNTTSHHKHNTTSHHKHNSMMHNTNSTKGGMHHHAPVINQGKNNHTMFHPFANPNKHNGTTNQGA